MSLAAVSGTEQRASTGRTLDFGYERFDRLRPAEPLAANLVSGEFAMKLLLFRSRASDDGEDLQRVVRRSLQRWSVAKPIFTAVASSSIPITYTKPRCGRFGFGGAVSASQRSTSS